MRDQHVLHWYPVSRHRSRSRSNNRGSLTKQQGLFIKEILQSGNSAQFQWSGNWVVADPVVDHLTLRVGDIVFCQLQIDGPYYLHKISRIFTRTRSVASSPLTGDQLAASAPRSGDENVGRMKYGISSPSGDLLGTCYSDTIYGRRAEDLHGRLIPPRGPCFDGAPVDVGSGVSKSFKLVASSI